MTRATCKVKDVSKYQSLADLLYIQSNNYQSMSGQEYIADAVDDLIAIKSDAYALAMLDEQIEALEDLHEYEQSLLQNDDDCPDYSESDLVPFIVSPVIVPTCFLGSLRSAFSFLLVKFNLTFKCEETKTVLKGGNDAAQREKVPIMLTVQQHEGQEAWLAAKKEADGCYDVLPFPDFYVMWCNEQGYFFDDMPA